MSRNEWVPLKHGRRFWHANDKIRLELGSLWRLIYDEKPEYSLSETERWSLRGYDFNGFCFEQNIRLIVYTRTSWFNLFASEFTADTPFK